MSKYRVESSDGCKQEIEADCLQIRDDGRILFYTEVAKDYDPSGLEIIAIFRSPLSVEKVEVQE